jgi:hypothetical protein
MERVGSRAITALVTIAEPDKNVSAASMTFIIENLLEPSSYVLSSGH